MAERNAAEFPSNTTRHGESPVCQVYAPQHICVHSQPIWKSKPADGNNLGAKGQRGGCLNCDSGNANFPNSQIDRGLGFQRDDWMRYGDHEHNAFPPRGLGSGLVNFFHSRADGDVAPKLRNRSICRGLIISNGQDPSSPITPTWPLPSNLLAGVEMPRDKAMHAERMASSEETNLDLASVRSIFKKLLSDDKMSWELSYGPKIATCDVKGEIEDLRLFMARDLRRNRELTPSQEALVQRQVKD